MLACIQVKADELGYQIVRNNTRYIVYNSKGEKIKQVLGYKKLYQFVYGKLKRM